MSIFIAYNGVKGKRIAVEFNKLLSKKNYIAELIDLNSISFITKHISDPRNIIVIFSKNSNEKAQNEKLFQKIDCKKLWSDEYDPNILPIVLISYYKRSVLNSSTDKLSNIIYKNIKFTEKQIELITQISVKDRFAPITRNIRSTRQLVTRININYSKLFDKDLIYYSNKAYYIHHDKS